MQFILTDACWGSPSQSNWDALAWALEPFTSLCKIKKRKRSWLTVFTSFGYNSILDWRTELNYSKTFYFSETFAVTKDACDCCNDRDFIASKIRADREHSVFKMQAARDHDKPYSMLMICTHVSEQHCISKQQQENYLQKYVSTWKDRKIENVTFFLLFFVIVLTIHQNRSHFTLSKSLFRKKT